MNDHAHARQPGRRGRLDRLRRDALAFEHDDAALVAAFDAARERAITPVRDEGNGAPKRRLVEFERAALTAFAALVIGEREQARTRIAALAAERTGLVTGWLIGRYYAYTGDPEATGWLRGAIEAIQLTSSMSVEATADTRAYRDPLLALVARELIAAAEAAADPELTGMVRRLAAGADPGRSVDAVLGRLADVSALEGQGRPLTILNGLLAGRTDESVAAWETLVGTDRDEERDWIVPLLAAGILGIDPDAERGRLRLRLHVPAAWLRWGAENIRIGDAAVGLRIERSAARIAITAEQSSGALPLTLILEPTVHAPVEQCFVDGQPADLALRPLPDRVIVPVQLALDAPRELRIELATG